MQLLDALHIAGVSRLMSESCLHHEMDELHPAPRSDMMSSYCTSIVVRNVRLKYVHTAPMVCSRQCRLPQRYPVIISLSSFETQFKSLDDCTMPHSPHDLQDRTFDCHLRVGLNDVPLHIIPLTSYAPLRSNTSSPPIG